MTHESGFTDLRLNRQEGQNQDNFWPSFTDIMTVILMIFMIAMVVLLLRNIELVNQLRSTMEAERAAMELAKTTGEEKESLALKLIAAENDISMLRIQLMRLEEVRLSQEATIGSQTSDLARLELANRDMKMRNDQLLAEKYSLTQRLERSQNELTSSQQALQTARQTIATTQRQLNQSQQQLTQAQQQLSQSQQQLAISQSELERLRSENEQTVNQLTLLQQRFSQQTGSLLSAQEAERQSVRALSAMKTDMDSLQEKYNKLIRPARSPAGRYLVEVRYTKRDGSLKIEYQTDEQPGYLPVDQQTLESILSRLKNSHSNGLYVKLIFPENSGLSFNEAWEFTSRLHSRYDYYYQDGEPVPVPVTPSQQ